MEAGANPYQRTGTNKSAVDLLAEKRDIYNLRLLDTNHLYRELVGQYTPPPDSPFVGVSSNGEDGMGNVSLILNDEGLALPVILILRGIYPWRTVGTNHAIIEITDNATRTEAIVEWLPDKNALRSLSSNFLDGESLRKLPGKAPTLDELRKQARAGHK